MAQGRGKFKSKVPKLSKEFATVQSQIQAFAEDLGQPISSTAEPVSPVDQDFLAAIFTNKPEKVKSLFSSDPKPNVNVTLLGMPALTLAVMRGNLAVVKYLVQEQKASVDLQCDDVQTVHNNPLHMAINVATNNPDQKEKYIEIVRFLVEEAKVNVNMNHESLSPLHAAIAGAQEDIVHILVEADADLYSKNAEQETPLQSIDKLMGFNQQGLQQVKYDLKGMSRKLFELRMKRDVKTLEKIKDYLEEKIKAYEAAHPEAKKIETIPNTQVDMSIFRETMTLQLRIMQFLTIGNLEGRDEFEYELTTLRQWRSNVKKIQSLRQEAAASIQTTEAQKTVVTQKQRNNEILYTAFLDGAMPNYAYNITLIVNMLLASQKKDEREKARTTCVQARQELEDSKDIDGEVYFLELLLHWSEEYPVILKRLTDLIQMKDALSKSNLLMIYYLKAYTHFCLDEYELAEKCYQKASSVYDGAPSSAVEYMQFGNVNEGLGNVCLKLKKYSDALAAFQRAANFFEMAEKRNKKETPTQAIYQLYPSACDFDLDYYKAQAGIFEAQHFLSLEESKPAVVSVPDQHLGQEEQEQKTVDSSAGKGEQAEQKKNHSPERSMVPRGCVPAVLNDAVPCDEEGFSNKGKKNRRKGKGRHKKAGKTSYILAALGVESRKPGESVFFKLLDQINQQSISGSVTKQFDDFKCAASLAREIQLLQELKEIDDQKFKAQSESLQLFFGGQRVLKNLLFCNGLIFSLSKETASLTSLFDLILPGLRSQWNRKFRVLKEAIQIVESNRELHPFQRSYQVALIFIKRYCDSLSFREKDPNSILNSKMAKLFRIMLGEKSFRALSEELEAHIETLAKDSANHSASPAPAESKISVSQVPASAFPAASQAKTIAKPQQSRRMKRG